MQMQKASFPILLILALLPAFFTGCRGYGTTGNNPAPSVSSISPTSRCSQTNFANCMPDERPPLWAYAVYMSVRWQNGR